MRLFRTIYEILSLIFQKLKRSCDSDHAPFRDNLSSVGWDLLCSTHIPNLKCLRLFATKKWKAMPDVKILVLSHPLGDLGVTHRVHLWLDGKCVVDFLLVLIETFFRQLLRLRRYARISVEIVVCERGWVTLSTNFKGKWGSSTNESWRLKTRVPGLSHGVVCVILRLAVLMQYRRVTDRQTRDDG